MSDIVMEHDNLGKWRQFYYPAASMCHAFQPTVKAGMTLNDKFKSGMWFLGAIGDYYRCYWYHKERNVENSQYAIFQKWVELGLFNAWRATWYWSLGEGGRRILIRYARGRSRPLALIGNYVHRENDK